MKVLLDAAVLESPATGIAKSTLGLYRACLHAAPALRVTALHRRPLAAPLPAAFTSLRRGSRLPRVLWRRSVLPLVVLGERAGVVHFPWNGDVPWLPSGTTVVTTLHDVLPLAIPGHFTDAAAERRYRKRLQRDLDRTHLVVTVSEYSKREITRHFVVRSDPLVLPNAPAQDLSPAPGAAGRTASVPPRPWRYFLYVGGYDRRKNLEALLRVLIGLRSDRRVEGRLVLVGARRHVSDELTRLVAKGTAMGAVEELGYVSDAVLADLFRHAIALVYPSAYEGFGLPLLEAMSLGCPVITTRRTAIPEVCGEAAYYFDPDDEASLGEGLTALERDERLRARLVHEGARQASKFSWDEASRKFLAALTALTASRGGTPHA